MPCYQDKQIFYLAYILRKLYILLELCTRINFVLILSLLLLHICKKNLYVEYPAIKSWLRHWIEADGTGRPIDGLPTAHSILAATHADRVARWRRPWARRVPVRRGHEGAAGTHRGRVCSRFRQGRDPIDLLCPARRPAAPPVRRRLVVNYPTGGLFVGQLMPWLLVVALATADRDRWP